MAPKSPDGNPRKLSRHPLTAKQDRFVHELMVDNNATQAAIRAGYSARTADTQASQLLRKTQVADALEVRRATMRKKTEITAVRWLEELVAVGFSDIGAIVKQDEHGEIELRNLDEMPPHIRACIASVECKETGTGRNQQKYTKVTLWPKLPALESLAKILGFNKARLDVELAAQENSGKGKPFDPRDLPDDEWELYKKMRARIIEQRGL